MNRPFTEQAVKQYADYTDRITSLTSMLRGHLTALAAAADDFRAAERALTTALDAGRDGGPELETVEAVAVRYAAATMLLQETALALNALLRSDAR